MRWTLSALLLLQPAPTLCAPIADGTDANALERVHALEMELKAERRKQESERRKQESEMLATVRLLLAAESDRRKLAAKILELEGRLNAADRAQDPSQYAVVPFKQPGHQRRRAQLARCYSGWEVTDAVKDPHFSFAHGGRADFRGRNGRERLLGRASRPQPAVDSNPAAPHRLLYCFHSAPGFAINIKTEAPPQAPDRAWRLLPPNRPSRRRTPPSSCTRVR